MTSQHLKLKPITDYSDFHFGRIFSEQKDEVLETDLIVEMSHSCRTEQAITRKIELLHLFSAAPELLDALKQLLLVDAPRSARHKETQGYTDSVVAKALSAIAKAEGK